MSEEIKPICQGCKKPVNQIQEYIEASAEMEISPEDYVKSEEGTYNPANGHFLCTDCYIKAGMPSLHHPYRWICP